MRNKGFTLIELLIVIVVVAVLGTVVVIAINPLEIINSANLAKAKTFAASVENNLAINRVGK
jgi:prepilin-type N-terminal cleavage/methylation domain-containing protein